MNLQNLVRCVGSTCHDGLLAPGMWDCAWRTPRGVGPPETHPHSQAVVVYAEYSSSTLTPGLQLCKECKITTPCQYRAPRSRRCSEESRWTSIGEEKRHTSLPEHPLHPIRR